MNKLLSAGLGALAALAVTAPSVHALDDLSHYVFVPNRASADVAVIDTRTDAVVARVQVGEVPHQVAVSPVLGKMGRDQHRRQHDLGDRSRDAGDDGHHPARP